MKSQKQCEQSIPIKFLNQYKKSIPKLPSKYTDVNFAGSYSKS